MYESGPVTNYKVSTGGLAAAYLKTLGIANGALTVFFLPFFLPSDKPTNA